MLLWAVPYEAIWQKRGTGSVEVQDSLARNLYEERNFYVENPKPPKRKNNDRRRGSLGVSGSASSGALWTARPLRDADASKATLKSDNRNDDYENALLR